MLAIFLKTNFILLSITPSFTSHQLIFSFILHLFTSKLHLNYLRKTKCQKSKKLFLNHTKH